MKPTLAPDHPSPVWRRALLATRVIIALLAVSVAVFGAFRLFFPTAVSIFNFDKPDSLSNTFFNPHDPEGKSVVNGQLDERKTLIATTGLVGDFSTAHISLIPSRKSLDPTGTVATLRHSAAAFFYPIDSAPARFPIGTLLVSDGRYAMIDASGQREDFDSLDVVKKLGYDPGAFLAVSPEEFALNKTDNIDSTGRPTASDFPLNPSDEFYPTGTLFVVDGAYYQLQRLGGTDQSAKPVLARFVSENAYLTRYKQNQAIARDADFLKSFALSEDWLGFASGALLSFADGIFVVDGDELRPISDPATFTALGFDWNRVIAASEEELGIYKRGKIVTLNTPQPIGTIFRDRDTDNLSLITPEHTRQLVTSRVLRQLLLSNATPIETSSKAIAQSVTCRLEPSGWRLNRHYDCDVALDVIATAPGTAYELTLDTPRTGIRFNTLEADFSTTVREGTFRGTLSNLKQLVLKRYAQ